MRWWAQGLRWGWSKGPWGSGPESRFDVRPREPLCPPTVCLHPPILSSPSASLSKHSPGPMAKKGSWAAVPYTYPKLSLSRARGRPPGSLQGSQQPEHSPARDMKAGGLLARSLAGGRKASFPERCQLSDRSCEPRRGPSMQDGPSLPGHLMPRRMASVGAQVMVSMQSVRRYCLLSRNQPESARPRTWMAG